MTDAAAAQPDVTEMTAVHRVFRNAFQAAPGLIGGVADGDTEPAAVVGAFFTNVLEFLHVHHGGEDELLFPKLVARAPDAALVERIAGQHAAVDGALAATHATLAEWIASGSSDVGNVLIGELEALANVLLPHLDEEEEQILPLVTDHITLAEWEELPGHAMQSFGGDNMWLILGLVREQFTQEQKDRMLEGMPPPLVDAWKTVGLDAYKATVQSLVGSPA